MTRDTLSLRTERKDEVRQERRRRSDATIDGSQRKKLAIPEHVEAWAQKEGRTLRWVSDEGNNLYARTKLDDYDVVEGVEPIPAVIDKKKGTVAKQVLLSKPNEFVEEDRQKREVARREKEAALLRGKDPEDPIAASDAFYAVEGNKISRGGP